MAKKDQRVGSTSSMDISPLLKEVYPKLKKKKKSKRWGRISRLLETDKN